MTHYIALIHKDAGSCYGVSFPDVPGVFTAGDTIDEAMQIRNTQIVDELSLPPVKIHCSVLAEDAIKAAIADYKKKSPVEAQQTVQS